MNIEKESIGILNEIITITLEESDYINNVTKKLKEIKRTASIKGFRPGTAPMPIIQKLFGKSVLHEEIEKFIGKALIDYLKSNDIQILLFPMLIDTNLNDAIEKEDPIIKFKFEIGLKPKINFIFSPDIKLNYYIIKITEDLIENEIERQKNKFGYYEEIDEIKNDSYITLSIKSENFKEKKIFFNLGEINQDKIDLFLGKKLQETIKLDLKELFNDNKKIAQFLHITEKDVPEGKIEIECNIELIEKFIPAENNKELWDNVFPDLNISNESEFRENIKNQIKIKFDWYSEKLFKTNMWNYILENCTIDLPENFIKKAYKIEDEKEIEEEFINLKKEIFLDNFLNNNNLKIEDYEVEKYTNDYIRDYYKEFYNVNLPDEYIKKKTKMTLEDKNEFFRFYYMVAENKLINHVKEKVTLTFEEVTFEDFINLLIKTYNKKE